MVNVGKYTSHGSMGTHIVDFTESPSLHPNIPEVTTLCCRTEVSRGCCSAGQWPSCLGPYGEWRVAFNGELSCRDGSGFKYPLQGSRVHILWPGGKLGKSSTQKCRLVVPRRAGPIGHTRPAEETMHQPLCQLVLDLAVQILFEVLGLWAQYDWHHGWLEFCSTLQMFSW